MKLELNLKLHILFTLFGQFDNYYSIHLFFSSNQVFSNEWKMKIIKYAVFAVAWAEGC